MHVHCWLILLRMHIDNVSPLLLARITVAVSRAAPGIKRK
jgi:hypothetical protein